MGNTLKEVLISNDSTKTEGNSVYTSSDKIFFCSELNTPLVKPLITWWCAKKIGSMSTQILTINS